MQYCYHIGKKLRKLREEKNITRKELAEKTYISEETIRRIEKEENDPRISTLYSLCENLDVDLQLLLNENKKDCDRLIEIRKKVRTLIYYGFIDDSDLLLNEINNRLIAEEVHINEIQASKHYYKGVAELIKGVDFNLAHKEFITALLYIHPDFNMDKFKEIKYSEFSLKILLCLAISKLRLGKIELFGLIIRYIFDNIDKSNDVYYIYTFYLALYYYRKEDLLKSLSICNISIIETRFSSKLFFLNMIYYLKGLILYKLANYRLSQQNFNKALLLSEISGCI